MKFTFTKKFALRVLFVAMAFVMVVAGICFARPQDFTLINYTGKTIVELYISPIETEDWEENVLDEDILPDGKSIKINFRTGTQKMWDFLVVFEDGSSTYWKNINLFDTFKVTLRKDHTAYLD